MDLRLAPLQTARLRLEPLTAETARAIVSGDLSGLTAAGLTAADGWPHEDTADGLAMAGKGGYPPGWLITADGAAEAVHAPAPRSRGMNPTPAS